MDKLQDVMDVKMMKKTIRWSVMATLAGAFFIYQLEGHGAEDNLAANPVSTFGKAIWWSFTTVLTGGFGDIHNPSSTSGSSFDGTVGGRGDGACRGIHRDADHYLCRPTK